MILARLPVIGIARRRSSPHGRSPSASRRHDAAALDRAVEELRAATASPNVRGHGMQCGGARPRSRLRCSGKGGSGDRAALEKGADATVPGRADGRSCGHVFAEIRGACGRCVAAAAKQVEALAGLKLTTSRRGGDRSGAEGLHWNARAFAPRRQSDHGLHRSCRAAAVPWTAIARRSTPCAACSHTPAGATGSKALGFHRFEHDARHSGSASRRRPAPHWGPASSCRSAPIADTARRSGRRGRDIERRDARRARRGMLGHAVGHRVQRRQQARRTRCRADSRSRAPACPAPARAPRTRGS